jgi:hypothetical protein
LNLRPLPQGQGSLRPVDAIDASRDVTLVWRDLIVKLTPVRDPADPADPREMNGDADADATRLFVRRQRRRDIDLASVRRQPVADSAADSLGDKSRTR